MRVSAGSFCIKDKDKFNAEDKRGAQKGELKAKSGFLSS